jgi:hypothetical protein
MAKPARGKGGAAGGREGGFPCHTRRKAYRRSLASPVVTLPLSGLFLRTAWTNSANGRVRDGRKGFPRRTPQGVALPSRRGQPLAWPAGPSILEGHRERLSAPIRGRPERARVGHGRQGGVFLAQRARVFNL